MTAFAWVGMLIAAGFGAPQAEAIARYSAVESSPDRGAFHLSMPLDPCANSRLGEGLLGLTGRLRAEVREFAGLPRNAACVPAEDQAAFLRFSFPLHYPACSERFIGGDLAALSRCWGRGASR